MKLTRFCLFDVDVDVSDKLIGPTHCLGSGHCHSFPKLLCYRVFCLDFGLVFGIFQLIEKSGGLLDGGVGGEVNSTGLQQLHCTDECITVRCRAGVRKICGFVVRPRRLRRVGGPPIRASLLALVTDVLWSKQLAGSCERSKEV